MNFDAAQIYTGSCSSAVAQILDNDKIIILEVHEGDNDGYDVSRVMMSTLACSKASKIIR